MTEAKAKEEKKLPTAAELVEDLELPASLNVRNLARDPESKVARKLRPGNYTGFMLSDGRRVRRAGARTTEVSMKDILENIDGVIEGIEYREIEVTATHEGETRVVTAEMLMSLRAKMKGEKYEPKMKVVESDEPPEETPPPPEENAPPPPPPPEMGDPPSQQPPMEVQSEKTQVIPETFSVVLTEKVAAKDKVKMSREIRNATGLDLKEVQNLMDAGSVIKSGLSKVEADTVKATLEKAGGSVEVRSEKKE